MADRVRVASLIHTEPHREPRTQSNFWSVTLPLLGFLMENGSHDMFRGGEGFPGEMTGCNRLFGDLLPNSGAVLDGLRFNFWIHIQSGPAASFRQPFQQSQFVWCVDRAGESTS